jgi:hypothetical protein
VLRRSKLDNFDNLSSRYAMISANGPLDEISAKFGIPMATLNAFRRQMRSTVAFAVESGLPTDVAIELAGNEWRTVIDEPVREGFATPEEGLVGLLEEEGGCVTIADACKLFRPSKPVSRQSLSKRIRAGEMIAYRTGGDIYLVPVWQFNKTGGLIDGLPEVLAAISKKIPGAGELSPFTFFLQADPITQGRTPLEALRAGDLEQVLAAVEARAG